jgi:hypothetical protein
MIIASSLPSMVSLFVSETMANVSQVSKMMSRYGDAVGYHLLLELCNDTAMYNTANGRLS